MTHLLTLRDVERRMSLVLDYFGNDTCQFTIHLSKYLEQHADLYDPRAMYDRALQMQDHFPSNQSQKARAEKKHEKKEEKKTDIGTVAKLLVGDSKSDSSGLEKTLEGGSSNELVAELSKSGISLEGPLTKSKSWASVVGSKPNSEQAKDAANTLKVAQAVRRRASIAKIKSKMGSEDGRKMSSVEKNMYVVDEALKIARTEDVEEEEIGECLASMFSGLTIEDEEDLPFEVKDKVIIIEGDNVGRCGEIQATREGKIREDHEGNFGIDVEMENGDIEGFWIHPEALQHRKFDGGDKIVVIEGDNENRAGVIQFNEGKIAMDNGSYGVDVKMEDGTEEGFWIHGASMKWQSEDKNKVWQAKVRDIKAKHEGDEKEEDDDDEDDFEYLPYEAVEGDQVDEVLAEQLNTFEIDVFVKRILCGKNNTKVRYRFGSKTHMVKCINGFLLVKQGKEWKDLIPILREIAKKEKEERNKEDSP